MTLSHLQAFQMWFFLLSRRYASALFVVIASRSFRSSQVRVLLRRLNVQFQKQLRDIAQGL